MKDGFSAYAYGCSWYSDLPLHAFQEAPPQPGEAEIDVERRPWPPPERAVQRRGRHTWKAADGFRFIDADGPVFDTFGGRRVIAYTGPEWNGKLPHLFYGTLTAFLLASRGLLPFHGTAVEWNGRGYLICGPSGAGKSSLAAALLLRDARLISDDLSVLHCDRAGGCPLLFAGRRHVRLYPATAEYLVESGAMLATGSHDGKLTVFPPLLEAQHPVPLYKIVLLGTDSPAPDATSKLETFTAQLFRPKSMHRLPGHFLRLASLKALTEQIGILTMPAVQVSSREDLDGLADAALRLLGGGQS